MTTTTITTTTDTIKTTNTNTTTTTCTDTNTETATHSLVTNITNNNDNNNINQNAKAQTESESKATNDSASNDPKDITNPAGNSTANCVQDTNQSCLKINSSTKIRNCNENNNLVSLEQDLDLNKLGSSNKVNLEPVEDKEKLININEKEQTASTEMINNLGIKESLCTVELVKSFHASRLGEASVLDAESYKLLQKLPINNPFYRFHKQSSSFREIQIRRATSFDFLTSIRKFKSDTDLCHAPKLTTTVATATNHINNFYNKNNIVVVANQCKKNNCMNNNATTVKRNQKLDIKFSRQQFNKLQNHQNNNCNSNSAAPSPPTVVQMLMKPNDFNNSTVITNPFSIFHDDETHLTLTVDKRLRCASSASRRQPRKPPGGTNSSTSSTGSVTLQTPKAFTSQQQLNNYHYLYGVPIKKFDRQDFPAMADVNNRNKKSKMPTSSSSSSVFKQIALRKISKTASASSSNIHVPLTGPQLKRLKITYPNHTQPLTTAPNNLTQHNKNTYFSRLQAKTRQGLQKLKDKCKQFNYATTQRTHLGRHHGSSSFKTMSKVESFRFISDRDNIRNYETRCMAAYHQDHKVKQGALYKSYKSELDLSKNLNYLEAYLNQNFEQQTSAQSVGRAQGQKIRRAFHQLSESTNKHKRHNSQISTESAISPKKLNFTKNNYENVQSLPLTKSDSLSSSDYASVFSANCGDDALGQQKNDKTDIGNRSNLRYEHPKMSEFIMYDSKNLKLKLQKPEELKSEGQTQQHQHQHHPLIEDEREVEENELVFKQELLRICQNKDSNYFEHDFPLHLPDNEEDELASNNIRILINNSEDFERHADDDWYKQRAENDSLTEVAFYQSLNEQLQQEQLYEESEQLNYDPFMHHINTELYPFHSETEDEKQLISSSSSLQGSSKLTNSHIYNYQNSNAEHLNVKSVHVQDYQTAPENVQQMQNLYKTYQGQTLAKNATLSNSSSSTSSIHQQHQALTQTSNKYKLINQSSLKTSTIAIPTPTTNQNLSSNTHHHTHYFPSQRNSTSSTENFDNFIATRSYPQKIPAKRSSFSQYTQRSPIQPQMNVLNYYGVSSSNDTYSVPFKLQSSSSSSNHSSKLSNSSSNSTTSSSHTNPLIMPSTHIGSSVTSATAVANSPAAQINLTKFYNNQNATTSSSNTSSSTVITNITAGPVSQSLLYNKEKRDKFILEYEC